MKTVLIFAHECAPYHRPQTMVGAQRPAQFAKYLGEFGWRAVVLCADNARRGQTDHPQALSDARADVQHALDKAAPDAPVIIPTPALAYDGWADRAWRATFKEGSPQPHKLTVTARKALTAAKIRSGDWSQPWQPCARAAAEVITQNIKIDAVVGEHSPDAGLFLAHWFHARYGTPWLADFRDPMPQGFQGAARRWYTAQGRKLTSTAAGTINVTPYWAELDKEMFGRPAWCLPNGFDPSEFPATTDTMPRTPYCEIIYAGNIIPSQRLAVFLEGLQQARLASGTDLGNKLRFVYRGGAHRQVAQEAEQAGVADLTDSAPPIPRLESLARLQQAQTLLLLSIAHPEQEDVYFRRGYYPAKTFEYFGAQRPILCVPGDGGLLDELLHTTRAGEICRTAAQVAAYLTDAVRAWDANNPAGYQPDTVAIAGYTRRNLTGQLAALLDNIRHK